MLFSITSCIVLVGKPKGKRPLGRPRRRWEDNIKMDLQEVGGGCEDWIELAQDRDRWRALVSTARHRTFKTRMCAPALSLGWLKDRQW